MNQIKGDEFYHEENVNRKFSLYFVNMIWYVIYKEIMEVCFIFILVFCEFAKEAISKSIVITLISKMSSSTEMNSTI